MLQTNHISYYYTQQQFIQIDDDVQIVDDEDGDRDEDEDARSALTISYL